MIIKVGDEYLDYDGDIEVERQAKLFSKISENNGDYSYEFELPATSKNIRILNIQDINITEKRIYNDMDVGIYSNGGGLIYSGFLKISRIDYVSIYCSFFAGNTNWISQLPTLLKEVDFSEYNVKFKDTLSAPNVTGSSEGIIFPFIDAGLLETRISEALVFEDFVPWMYVKTIVKKLFNSAGLKINGDILSDSIYNRLIITTANNEWYQDFIDARTINVGKDVDQALPASPTITTVTFPDSTFPEFIGDNNNWDTGTSRYTADVDMTIELEWFNSIDVLVTATGSGIFRNGVNITEVYRRRQRANGPAPALLVNYDEIPLLAGDFIEIKVEPLIAGSMFQNSYLKIKPVKFDTVYANAIPPDEKSTDFLNKVFELFNTIIDFEPFSKTITINLFKHIKSRSEQDLTNYMSGDVTIDFFELIDGYGQINTFEYQGSGTNKDSDYKRKNIIPFGGGQALVDNKYIQKEAQIIQSDFIAGINYDNEVFKNILQLPLLTTGNIGDEITVSSVANVAGIARFDCSAVHDLRIGDLVRISEFKNYRNGEGVISGIPTTTQFVIYNLPFTLTDTGKAQRLDISLEQTDTCIALVNAETNSSDIGLTQYAINNGVATSVYTKLNYAWFQKKTVGFNIDNVYGDLSFGDISLLGYDVRINMIDNYFDGFVKVLNDPVKVIADFIIPENIFRGMLLSHPVRLETTKFNGSFYINRITGYKDSYTPCTFELIKIS